jgi:hypothetical protein
VSETVTETEVWTGFWRPGPKAAWRRVCSAGSSGEAWARLLARADLPSGDLCVARGDDPTFPRPQERRVP